MDVKQPNGIQKVSEATAIGSWNYKGITYVPGNEPHAFSSSSVQPIKGCMGMSMKQPRKHEQRKACCRGISQGGFAIIFFFDIRPVLNSGVHKHFGRQPGRLLMRPVGRARYLDVDLAVHSGAY